MARFVTKNLTPIELRTAKKDLSASLKALHGSVKLGAKEAAAIDAVRTKALKEANKALAEAAKVHAAAVKAATKAHEAAAKAHAKEQAKLDVQIKAHEAKIKQIEEAQAANKAESETAEA